MQRVERSARRAEPLGERVEGVKYYRSILFVLLVGIALLVGFNLRVLSIRELTNPNPLVTYLLISTSCLIVVAVAAIAAYAISAVKLEADVLVLNERLQNKANLIRSLEEQRHDFRNQLSVVLGMLNLGWHQHATGFLRRVIDGDQATDTDRKLDYERDFYSFYGFLIHKSFAASNRNVLIRLEIVSNQLPSIPSDLLMRIAGNLIDNALEAASSVDGGRVFVRVQAEDDQWTLTVWNNGPVIPKDVLSQICEVGFTTKPGPGRGWGLPSVQRILTDYGAALEYYSTPDDGTSFVVRFALTQARLGSAVTNQ